MAQDTPFDPKLHQELVEIYHQLTNAGRVYDLDQGRWDPKEFLAHLALRKLAIEKITEAVRAGHNRGTIVESLLYCFGLEPHWLTF